MDGDEFRSRICSPQLIREIFEFPSVADSIRLSKKFCNFNVEQMRNIFIQNLSPEFLIKNFNFQISAAGRENFTFSKYFDSQKNFIGTLKDLVSEARQKSKNLNGRQKKLLEAAAAKLGADELNSLSRLLQNQIPPEDRQKVWDRLKPSLERLSQMLNGTGADPFYEFRSESQNPAWASFGAESQNPVWVPFGAESRDSNWGPVRQRIINAISQLDSIFGEQMHNWRTVDDYGRSVMMLAQLLRKDVSVLSNRKTEKFRDLLDNSFDINFWLQRQYGLSAGGTAGFQNADVVLSQLLQHGTRSFCSSQKLTQVLTIFNPVDRKEIENLL